MDPTEIILRFALVFTAAFLFGLERQFSHKPTGFGTFTFVSVGSCALAITAITLGNGAPLPLLGSIVTGIGFLGAGALIRTTDKIFGFTTAASIWVFATIGLTTGVGEYLVASILYALVWAIVIVDKFLENRGIGTHHRKIRLITKGIVPKEEVLSVFGDKRWKLMSIETNKKAKTSSILYLVECSREDISEINNNLFKKSWLVSHKIE